MTEASTAVRLARSRIDSHSVPPAAKRAARSLSVTTGRLTHRARMLPGFLIVGAQRCGTTSMYRALSQHPAVLKAVLHKGVHYFDTGYDHGLAWYQGHFPLRARRRSGPASRRRDPTDIRIQPVLHVPPACGPADQLATFPASSCSCWCVIRSSGPTRPTPTNWPGDTRPSRSSGPWSWRISGCAARPSGSISQPGYLSRSHQHQAYLARGQYADQLERLEKLFGRDRMHVVDSGDFFSNPEPVYDEVLDFLGLRQHGYPVFERHNARPALAHAGDAARTAHEHFQPHDERLVRWLGEPPSWRLVPRPY